MIIAIMVPFVVFFTKPKKAEAQFVDPVGAVWDGIKTAYGFIEKSATVKGVAIAVQNVAKEVFKATLQTIARRMLADLTASTVGWINTEHFGQPLFLTNPESFFKDIAKGQIKNFIDRIGYDPNRFPFGRQYALQVLDSYRRQFEDNASYSLSVATTVPDLAYQRAYRENFNVGGWNGFLLNTQYPQNNPIGFSFIATEVLGRNLAGTTQSVADSVRSTLQQGQGFLSPQVCLDDNGQPRDGLVINPYNPPIFSFNPPASLMAERPELSTYETDGVVDYEKYNTDFAAWQSRYYSARDVAQSSWSEENTCSPDRLRTTTPGAVAANSIMNALGTTQRQGELSAALGNSLSAVFDALINKFMNQGLNALASVIGPAPDDWTYEGQSLGVSPDGTNGDDDWRNRSDEIVSVADFKRELAGRTIIKNPVDGAIIDDVIGKYTDPYNIGIVTSPPGVVPEEYYFVPADKIYTPGAIANTEEELLLMDNKGWDTSYDQRIIDPDPSKIAGIAQWMKQIPNQVKTLDQCLPGPDKGWEKRLDDEKSRQVNDIIQARFTGTSKDDRDNVTGTLSRVIASFKDFVDSKMAESLPSGIIFMDEIKKLDTLIDQTKALTDARREKSSTLLRLKSISTSLDSSFAVRDSDGKIISYTEPTPGSTGERNLLTLRRSYLAIRESISSSSSIEKTRVQLKTLLNEYDYLAELNTTCVVERDSEGWGSPTGVGEAANPNITPASFTWIRQYDGSSGSGLPGSCTATTSNSGSKEQSCTTPRTKTKTEIETFCELPIIGGHAEGELIVENRGRTGPSPLFKAQTGSVIVPPNYYGNPDSVMFPEIPMVNAMDIGDINVAIDIRCRTIWKASNVDYTRSGDVGF